MFLTINDIREVGLKMTEKIGVDYTGYSINFLRRRLTVIFEKLNLHKVQDIDSILSDPKKTDELAYSMIVPGTEMFRDPGFWRSLRSLLNDRQTLKVWMPGVTNGFEMYSLLVLLKMIGINDAKIVCNVQSDILKSEIESLCIPQKYDDVNRSNFERLESDMKYEDFFETTGDGNVKPNGDLLSHVTFVRGWFMNTPADEYDLILFRNILLEYSPSLHEKAVEYLAKSLKQGGMLAIGVKEVLLSRNTQLKSVDPSESIYIR